MSLLERDAELDALMALLEGAREGRGRLVLVRGAAGVGKSALVHALGQRAADDVPVLTGQCDPVTVAPPLGPLAEMTRMAGAAAGREPVGLNTAWTWLLRQLTASAPPTVLIFEDVHWADPATLDVLCYLAPRIEATRLLVVATYRDTEIGASHPLRVALGDIARCPGVRRISLGGLSVEAVTTLAEGSVLDADELYRVSRGNPFLVTERLAAPDEELPQTVREAIAGRLARLDSEARQVAEAVAILGPGTRTETLDLVTPHWRDCEDDVTQTGLLWDVGGVPAYRHDLARSAVLGQMSGEKRRRLHAAALASLRTIRSTDDDLARMAQHAAEAEDTAAVLELAPAAGAQALASASYTEAAQHFSRALRHAELLPDDAVAALHVGLSFASFLSGQMVSAIEARRAAMVTHQRLGDRYAEGEDLAWLAQMYWTVGRDAEGRRAGQAAVDCLEPLGPSPKLAVAYAGLAHLRAMSPQPGSAHHLVATAVDLANRFGLDEVAAEARCHGETARAMAGTQAEDTDLEKIWLENCETAPVVAGRAAVIWVWSLTEQRDPREALTRADQMVAYCRVHNLSSFGAAIEGNRARALLSMGRWDDAEAQAVAVLGRPDQPRITRIWSMMALASVRARRGLGSADLLLEELATAFEPEDHAFRWVAAPLAEAAWLAGDDQAAAEFVQRGMSLASGECAPWASGELQRWARVVKFAVEGECSVAKPFALERDGEWAAAAADWEARGCAYDAALARLDGDGAAVRRALDAFEGMGAGTAALRTRQLMRERGIRMLPRQRSTTKANQHGLTNRQLEVLGLIGQGLSDREIAAELTLSPKTVGHHVEAILTKLGVSGRREAARQLR